MNSSNRARIDRCRDKIEHNNDRDARLIGRSTVIKREATEV